MSANDKQVGGSHYQSEYQHWDLMIDLYGQDYPKAQITRYVSRWRKKNGVQDLEKSVHYAEKLLELVENGRRTYKENLTNVYKFCTLNKLNSEDSDLICAAMQAATWEAVKTLIASLNTLIASEVASHALPGQVAFSESTEASTTKE